MNNRDLEQQIRELRPASLPAELRAQLDASEPPVEIGRSRKPLALLAVAAVLIAAATLAVLLQPNPGTSGVAESTDATDEHFSVVQQESTLLSSRTLETRKHNGRLWELVENQWRDETVAMCSATTARIRSTEIRPEVVWQPVEFY